MSDPVTNAQVEDVLSSIRRLVGENKGSPASEQRNAPSERLVLTPQLRVSGLDVLTLEPKDAVDTSESWFEFEEPPFSEDDIEDLEAQFANELREAPSEIPEASVSEPEDEPQSDQSIEAFFASGRGTSSAALSEKISALETAIARTSDFYEPDGDDDDAFAERQMAPMGWKPDVVLDGTGAPLPEPVDHAAQDHDEAPDEQVIEEDFLRELVVDIVRSELQGAAIAKVVRDELQGELGERITRNVRKLVRKEIHRALTTRELD